jgi:hypothetical protein
MIRMKGDHHARTPSCFAVADRLETKETTQRHEQPFVAKVALAYASRPCRAHIPARGV